MREESRRTESIVLGWLSRSPNRSPNHVSSPRRLRTSQPRIITQEAAYIQKFHDYPYNTYLSFEMIASLLHQNFGAQYQTADVFHEFVAGARYSCQAGSSGKTALLKDERPSSMQRSRDSRRLQPGRAYPAMSTLL
jgi:hypothetical protein